MRFSSVVTPSPNLDPSFRSQWLHYYSPLEIVPRAPHHAQDPTRLSPFAHAVSTWIIYLNYCHTLPCVNPAIQRFALTISGLLNLSSLNYTLNFSSVRLSPLTNKLKQ